MADTPFSRLKFGEAAAEDEAEKNPKLLIDSFVDRWDLERRMNEGDVFLLIGPKGSGKSTTVEYLKLKPTASGARVFANVRDLGAVLQDISGDSNMGRLEQSSQTEASWRYYVWSCLFASLMYDESSDLYRNSDCRKLMNDLRAWGIIDQNGEATGDFRSIFRSVKKRQHNFTIPGSFLPQSRNYSDNVTIHGEQIVDVLSKLVTSARTPNRHFVSLDGLDSGIIGSGNYWVVLANLLRGTNDIHRKLRSAQSSIRIALLCRSDILLKIPLPDSNKIRQGWGAELDWAYGSDNARDSYLWDLIERKARANGATVSNILDYFPPVMTYGAGERSPIPEYLMQLTRQTPRDILMLFRKIAQNSVGASKLDIARIRAGVNEYCKQYFAGEIANEIAGLAPHSIATSLVGSIGRIGKRRFDRREFMDVFGNILERNSFDPDELLQQLFLAGAIANIVPGQRRDYVQFYHRRNHAELNPSGPFLMHPALALGLNVQM